MSDPRREEVVARARSLAEEEITDLVALAEDKQLARIVANRKLFGRTLAILYLEQEKELQEASADAEGYRELAKTSRELYVGEAAKALRMRDPVTGQVVGQNNLFRILVKEGVLYRTTTRRIQVYEFRQRYARYFVKKATTVGNLGRHAWTVMVTVEGLRFIRSLLERIGYEPIT